MPTSTYTPLANITLGSSAASVTFSSISQSYRDLILVIAGISSSTGGGCTITVNNDTTSNYDYVLVEANGSTKSTRASTGTGYFTMWNYNELGSSTSTLIYNFLDYSATDKHKSMLARINDSTEALSMANGRWMNTSAITTIKATAGFAANTTLSLYGIVA